jgi:hypothetical protein
MTSKQLNRALVRVLIFSVIGISLNWLFFRASFNLTTASMTIFIFAILNVLYELGAYLFQRRPRNS